LPTYRRHQLLPRAVQSLRNQTFTDWVCELHNDDPADPFPAELVRRVGDPRIILHTHPKNLGASATFNLIFRPAPESFYSLLEDDNWWDPAFLATMVAALERHPSVTAAWNNQRIWQENSDGTWTDTGRLANPLAEGPPRLVGWGQPQQAMGAVHANGAMLLRSGGRAFSVPAVPFTGMEAFRERLLPHPLLYVPAPLAHFSITRDSARARDGADWAALLTLLVNTFVRHSSQPADTCRILWEHYRTQQPPPTNILIYSALTEPTCWPFLRFFRLADWWRFLRGLVRRPHFFWPIFRARARHPEWWNPLDAATMARFRERDATPSSS
jgi:hypothetical protein